MTADEKLARASGEVMALKFILLEFIRASARHDDGFADVLPKMFGYLDTLAEDAALSFGGQGEAGYITYFAATIEEFRSSLLVATGPGPESQTR